MYCLPCETGVPCSFFSVRDERKVVSIVWPSVLSLNNLKITNRKKSNEKHLYGRNIFTSVNF